MLRRFARLFGIVQICLVALGSSCLAQTTPEERDLMRQHHVKQVIKKQYYLFRGEDDRVSCAFVENYDTLGNRVSVENKTSSTGFGMAETLNGSTLFTYDALGNALSIYRASEWEVRADSFHYDYNGTCTVVRERKSLYSNGEHMYDLIREFEHDSSGRIVLVVQRNGDGTIQATHRHEFSADGCSFRTLWGSDLKFKRPHSTTTRECDTAGRVIVERTLMNDKRKYEKRYTYDEEGRCVLELSEGTTIQFHFNTQGLPSEFVKTSEQRNLSFRETQEYSYW